MKSLFTRSMGRAQMHGVSYECNSVTLFSSCSNLFDVVFAINIISLDCSVLPSHLYIDVMSGRMFTQATIFSSIKILPIFDASSKFGKVIYMKFIVIFSFYSILEVNINIILYIISTCC